MRHQHARKKYASIFFILMPCYPLAMHRNITLDIARTFAICLMVVFHFIYDLKFFGYINWNIPDGHGWVQFRWIIISLFFLCLGVSLSFAHAKQFKGRKFFLRLMQISLSALLISVATFFAINDNWIFFGVLHFLALSSVIVIFFVSYPRVSLSIGIVFVVIGVMQVVPSRWPFHLLFDGLPKYTNDFVAIFPWLGLVFIGVSLGHSEWMKNDVLAPSLSNSKHLATLVWPGQHSLSIYLLHQPIMMGILFLISLA
ncbi:heparan-alpha-glucosaminide N-acetyltransferase [Glaciecola petra]|uniref:Heparan-alpha-glucosaminide N-acetyltransferase n=1 Tax=Glaciecola petra TaxID=3075602 RepID=A0ABU2ZN56_9ALTE|nr:heparan-alpha-glucosaminide N-acetyltransferase [Aestuariibacter sp. P117]MDT0594063.1 heparan-alpha-glucosaminide N-acetyltransferase [Aestuariibacter sp. P117]